jgi:hypothetical protein
MTGKPYYSCMEADIIVVEAMYRAYWNALEQYYIELDEEASTFDELSDLMSAFMNCGGSFDNLDKHLESMKPLMNQFNKSRDKNLTTKLWME